MLKKLISILCLLVYFFATTEAKQLFKIPVIFQHYAEHQLENQGLSLIDFLDMHYMHGSPFDQDYDRDMKLPFKSTGDVFSFFPLTADRMPISCTVVCPQKNIELAVRTSAFDKPCTLAEPSIWQPPRTEV